MRYCARQEALVQQRSSHAAVLRKSFHGRVDALHGHKQHGSLDPKFASFKVFWYQSRSPRITNGKPKYLLRPKPHNGFPARRPSTVLGPYGFSNASAYGHSPSQRAVKLHIRIFQILYIVFMLNPSRKHVTKTQNMKKNADIVDPETRHEAHDSNSIDLPPDFPTPTQGTPSPCMEYWIASSVQLAR